MDTTKALHNHIQLVFGLIAATRLVRGGQNNRIPVLTVPTLAACAYAFWKDLTAPLTIALMIGQVRLFSMLPCPDIAHPNDSSALLSKLL